MALRERKARVGAIPEGGMADIAFLLLVFFLVTTTIDMDKGLGIILPAEGQELEINKKNISILSKVNTVGKFDVDLKIHKDLTHPIKINVIGDIVKSKKKKTKKDDAPKDDTKDTSVSPEKETKSSTSAEDSKSEVESKDSKKESKESKK